MPSPNVNTPEVDQSTSAAVAAPAGTMLVGTTKQGPAFVPITITKFEEFKQIFGDLDPNHQVSYAAKSYLRNGASLKVARVLGHADGTGNTNGYTVGVISSIIDSHDDQWTAGNVLAVIHHSGVNAGGEGNVVTVTGSTGDANNFVFKVGTIFAATASFVTSSANYITKVLNTDPTKFSTYGHYLAENYRYKRPIASASWGVVNTISSSFVAFTRDFEGGSSAWVKSQPQGGLEFDLVRFHTLAHGRATNDAVKVTVTNIRPSQAPTVEPYGTFDIHIRDFYDTDLRPSVLESFTNLSLDPNSDSYVVRRIGDSYEEFDTTDRKFVMYGEHPARSRHIRV